MFRSLLRLLKWDWSSKTEFSHDLTEGQINQIQKISKSEGWSAYVQAVDSKIQELAEELLSAQSTERMWEARGKVVGLRESILMVEAIINQKEQKDERERLAAERDTDRAHRRFGAIRNTPFSRTASTKDIHRG